MKRYFVIEVEPFEHYDKRFYLRRERTDSSGNTYDVYFFPSLCPQVMHTQEEANLNLDYFKTAYPSRTADIKFIG